MASIPNLTAPLALQRPDATPLTGREMAGSDEPGSTFATLVAQNLNKTSVNGLRTDSRHMALPEPGATDDDFQERALGVFTQRQQVIASNIANADTPNYKARDVDMQEAMRAALEPQVPQLAMNATSPNHLADKTQRMAQALALKYQLPGQGSIDGNTVEMDSERAKFAENTIRLEFALNQVQGDFKDQAKLLSSLKD